MTTNRVKLIARTLCLVTLSVFIVSCTEQQVEGSKTTYSFSTWLPIVVAIVGVLIAAFGFMIRGASPRRLHMTLMFIGVVAAVIGAPGIALDRIVIDDDHFSLKTGFWFAPTQHDIKWSEVKSVEVVQRRKGADIVFQKNAGDRESVPMSNLAETAMDKILSMAKAHNLEVSDGRGN